MLLEVSVQFALATKLTTLVLDAGSCKDTIQSRNQNQCQHGRYCQTTDYGNCHRTPHLRTLTTADSHRDHTENGCGCGHQYRTKTALTGSYHRIYNCQPAFPTKGNVVDEHNTVLHHNTNQHDTSQQTHN